MTRRSSYVPMPVTYAAVGASNAPDLLRFPPDGTTPFEESLLIGSGQDRFLAAVSLLMTWGAHRASGEEVADIVRGDGGQYAGLTFDAAGSAEAPAAREDHFGPDGEPYLTSGTTATISRNSGKQMRRVRVVYVIDEPNRVGFAIGTADDDGAIGEELFTVDHRSDDTVWAVARGFLGSTSALKGRSQIRGAIARAKQHLEAMLPGVVPDAAPVEHEAAAQAPAPLPATPVHEAAAIPEQQAPAAPEAPVPPMPESPVSEAPLREPVAPAAETPATATPVAPAEPDHAAPESEAVAPGTEADVAPAAEAAPAAPEVAIEAAAEELEVEASVAPETAFETSASDEVSVSEAVSIEPHEAPAANVETEPGPEPEPVPAAEPEIGGPVDAPSDAPSDAAGIPAAVTAKSWGKSKGKATGGKSPGAKASKSNSKHRGGKPRGGKA